MPRGNIYLGKEYRIKLPKDSILQRIENLGYDYILMRDTLKSKSADEYNLSKQSYYQISNVVIKEKEVVIDTIKNCLLYTSPSPRDATLSRMPSSA